MGGRFGRDGSRSPAPGSIRPGRAKDRYAIYVWRSERHGGDTKTEKSRRTLALPQRCVEALRQHMEQQERDRLMAGELWQEHGLVFASRVGTPLSANNVIRAFKVAAEVDGLPHEIARHARIRNRGADLCGCAIDIAGDALSIAHPKALIDFRIDPELGALPELETRTQRQIAGFPALIGNEAVRASVRRVEGRNVLLDEGGFPMDGEPAEIERRGALLKQIGIDAVLA